MSEGWEALAFVSCEPSSCLCRLSVGFPSACMRWCRLSRGQKALCHQEGVVIRLSVRFRKGSEYCKLIDQQASTCCYWCRVAERKRSVLTNSLTTLGNFRQDHRMHITGVKHK